MKKKCLPALLAALMLGACGCGTAPKQDPSVTPEETSPSDLPQETETRPPERKSVSFLAVGDNLIHSRVYKTAAEHAEEGQEYNFYYCYEAIADKVAAADLAFINQETVMCGGEFEISGANLNFCSPDVLGDQLIDIGFDIFNLSNNHVLDKGVKGLSACLDYWDRQCEAHPGIIVEGVYRDYQDMCDYRITESNGIKIGILGYTDHTNGYALPRDSEMEIPYTGQEELIEKQVRELSAKADCVIVSAHWGVEDTHIVPDASKNLAEKLINWGADVVIGTGPHTLQTMEYIDRPDGGRGLVYYSLGNFISGQTDNFNMIGGMAEFRIVKENGAVTIEEPTLTPVITQYETGSLQNVRVVPYYSYTDEMEQNHGIPYSPAGSAKSWSWDVIERIVTENVPEEFRKLEP